MPRRKREETQPEEEEEVEVKQEVKLEYDIPIPFNDAPSTSSSSSSIIDPKFVYLQHLDLSELEEETKAILFKNKIGFKSLFGIDKATLKEVGIVLGDVVSLLTFAEKCKINGNVVPPRLFVASPPLPPPPPAHEKPADDGFAQKLIQAFDSSISQSSLETVFKHLQFSYEFWNLSEYDLLAIFGYDNKETALKIFNAQQYLVHEEHWSQLRMFIGRKSVQSFLSKESLDDASSLDSYRVPEFVSQLVKVTPKKSATIVIYCSILWNFACLSDEGKELLGRQDVVDSLVTSRRYITSADAVQCWSLATSSITYLESNKKLFACQAVVDALVAVSKYAATADAVHVWSCAICSITCLESNRKLFGFSSIVDSFVTTSKYATTSAAVRWWIGAIDIITYSNDVDVCRVFSSSVAFKQVFFSLKQILDQMPEDEDTRDGKENFEKVEKRLW